MFPYQIRPRKKVAFAIEKVERSQKPTDEQFYGSLMVVHMHGKDWCMNIIFEKHTFTLVNNTQQKTRQP
jgi:uncharacterized Rossmann fold enzyme